MERVTKKDIKKLAQNPIFFAMMMDKSELEHVIVTFVYYVGGKDLLFTIERNLPEYVLRKKMKKEEERKKAKKEEIKRAAREDF